MLGTFLSRLEIETGPLTVDLMTLPPGSVISITMEDGCAITMTLAYGFSESGQNGVCGVSVHTTSYLFMGRLKNPYKTVVPRWITPGKTMIISGTRTSKVRNVQQLKPRDH